MSTSFRRLTGAAIATTLIAASALVFAPSASALTTPSSIKCGIFASDCKSAKAWYEAYWNYGITFVPYSDAGSSAALDGLRVMAAMAVGNAVGGTGSGLLDNIDAELGRLWRTRAKMACAKNALYETANTIRVRKQAIDGMTSTFGKMKKAAGANKTLKAYASLGKAAMDSADRVNQRKRGEELYAALMNC